MSSASNENEFIYRKMIERQRRWYEHDKGDMLRDERGRFVPTAVCPFPEWSPQDKLMERAWLESLPTNVPQARLITSFQHPSELLELVHTLPSTGFVIKPAGEPWLPPAHVFYISSHTPLPHASPRTPPTSTLCWVQGVAGLAASSSCAMDTSNYTTARSFPPRRPLMHRCWFETCSV